MSIKQIAEGFSLSHAQILDGETTYLDAVAAAAAETEDIYGVSSGSLEPDTDSYDNEGDDAVLSTWEWLNKAAVNVQAGYISLPLLAEITGRTVTTTDDGDAENPKETHGFDLWHEDDLNVASRPMLLKVPGKDSDGTPVDMVIGLYRVSFAPMSFDGPSYKDGLKVNYNGTALWSPTDETGEPHADGKKRIGRLLLIER